MKRSVNKVSVWFLTIALLVLMGNMSIAVAKDKKVKVVCGENIIAMIDVPNGDLYFAVDQNTNELTVQARAKMGVGSATFSLATAKLRLKPDHDLSTTDQGEIEFPESHETSSDSYVVMGLADPGTTLKYTGDQALRAAVGYLDLSKSLEVVRDGNDVGVKIRTTWSYELVRTTGAFGDLDKGVIPPAAGENFSGSVKVRMPGKTAATLAATQRRIGRMAYGQPANTGYQWRIGSTLVVTIDEPATLKQAGLCLSKLHLERTSNPPVVADDE